MGSAATKSLRLVSAMCTERRPAWRESPQMALTLLPATQKSASAGICSSICHPMRARNRGCLGGTRLPGGSRPINEAC